MITSQSIIVYHSEAEKAADMFVMAHPSLSYIGVALFVAFFLFVVYLIFKCRP